MSSINDKKSIAKTIQNVLTQEDIDTIAREYTNDKSVRVLGYEIEELWKTKTGYSRTHKRLKITLQKSNSNNAETVSFFLKTIPYDLEATRDLFIDIEIFSKESNFYNKIVPHLRKIVYNEKWIATCFFATNDAIVLEELSLKDYRIFGHKMIDNVDALKSALRSLARLHGSSIIVEDRLNRNAKRPITLNERFADTLHESFFTRTGSVLQHFLTPYFNASSSLAKKFGRDPEIVEKAFDKVCHMMKPSKTYRNVICHGNLWSNNLMFSDDSTDPYSCILVDFQIVRYAPIAMDLLQLLHLNASRTFRKDNENDLVVFYLSFLEKIIRDNDVAGTAKVPTLEEIYAGMDEFRLYGLVAAAMYNPLNLMDPSDLANYTKDADSFNAFILGDRVDLTLAYLEKNESYKIRVEECIVELAEKIKSMDSANEQVITESVKNTVTPVDVTVVAQKYANDEFVRVLYHCIGDYSKDKLGYSTDHKILNIKFQKSNDSETVFASFFVKSVPYDVQLQVDFLASAGIFFKESRFFRQVIPRLIENCKCEKWYPECYLAKEDAIVLENLKNRGYKMINIDDDVAALKSALVSLARLHGSSMLMEERLNRESENRRTLNEYYPNIFHETFFIAGVVANCVSNVFEVSCTLAKNFGYNADNLRKQFDRMYELVGQSKKHRNVVCHGDLWRNNMMFDDNYNCVLVDFQYVRYAPIATDLVQFLHLNATRTFRGKHERELIEFYHSNLEKIINDNNMTKSVKVPTIEDIFTGMDDMRLLGLVTACCYFPVSLIGVDDNTTVERGKDLDFVKIVLSADNLDFLLTYMKTNERYKKRLEDAVVELAEHVELFHE